MPPPFSGVLSLSFSLPFVWGTANRCRALLNRREILSWLSWPHFVVQSRFKQDGSWCLCNFLLCTNTRTWILNAELPGLISLTTVLSKCNHLWLCTLGRRSSRNCPAIQSAHSLIMEDSALLCTGRGTSTRFCQKTKTTNSEGVVPYIFVGLIIYPKVFWLTNLFLAPCNLNKKKCCGFFFFKSCFDYKIEGVGVEEDHV